MKEWIQRVLGVVGLRVVRAQHARKYLPKPNVDNIEIVVRLFALAGKKITLVQVGACDGVTSDSIYPYIKAGHVQAYLIEPSNVNFSKLSEFYAGVQNVVPIRAAVADKNEVRTLYTIKDEGRWKDNGWARQLASFYKEHLLKLKIFDHEIAEEQVPCFTLATILAENQLADLDVLLVDTEGYDGEIVKMALGLQRLPIFIAFENAQIVQNYPQPQLNELYALLEAKGYVWTHDRINTLAVRKDFLVS
jgi:FkbM family methyltransferase